MKPTDLNSFNTLSNLVGKGTSLVVQGTRMDFKTNTYEVNFGKEVIISGKVLNQVIATLVIQNLGIKKTPFFM